VGPSDPSFNSATPTLVCYRHVAMTRFLWLLLVIVAGTSCGGKNASNQTATKPATPAETTSAVPKTTDGHNAKSGNVPMAPGAEYKAPTCVYHAGVASYANCLAGADGACTHFGGSCAPADKCMFDAASKLNKTCSKLSDGTCEEFAAPCNPAPGCWFDSKDNLFRSCSSATGGACTKWGGLCSPAT
jgi:hypothetical protein